MVFNHKNTDAIKVRFKRVGQVYILQYKYRPTSFKEWLFGKWYTVMHYFLPATTKKKDLKETLEGIAKYRVFEDLNKYVLVPLKKKSVKKVINTLNFNEHIAKKKK